MSTEAYKRVIGMYFPEKAEPAYADPYWFQYQQLQMEVQALAASQKSSKSIEELVREAYGAGLLNVAPSKMVSGASNKKSASRCDVCQLELCHDLDAYYGKNPNGQHHCVKCRKLKGIT